MKVNKKITPKIKLIDKDDLMCSIMRTNQEITEKIRLIDQTDPKKYNHEIVVNNVLNVLELCERWFQSFTKLDMFSTDDLEVTVVVDDKEKLIGVHKPIIKLLIEALQDEVMGSQLIVDPEKVYHYDSMINALRWALGIENKVVIILSDGKKLQF